jgi:rhodanese-related sulfurtransferase
MWKLITWTALGVGASNCLSAMTVTELQQQLAKGEKLTVIDVRSPTLFGRGHIPGAINVPAALCPEKNLPPLGKVVVCGEGLGRDTVDSAANALAAKPGITVEMLDGGFVAWESVQALTTKSRGLQPETPNYITYAQLKAAKADDLVLVDLRKRPSAKHKLVANEAVPSSQTLTDLSQEFPGKRVMYTAFEAGARRQLREGSAAPLLVLVDNGDGAAQAMARTLKANGVKRYVILVGGELILARHGQAGLQRTGSGTRVVSSNPPAPQ